MIRHDAEANILLRWGKLYSLLPWNVSLVMFALWHPCVSTQRRICQSVWPGMPFFRGHAELWPGLILRHWAVMHMESPWRLVFPALVLHLILTVPPNVQSLQSLEGQFLPPPWSQRLDENLLGAFRSQLDCTSLSCIQSLHLSLRFSFWLGRIIVQQGGRRPKCELNLIPFVCNGKATWGVWVRSFFNILMHGWSSAVEEEMRFLGWRYSFLCSPDVSKALEARWRYGEVYFRNTALRFIEC